MQAALEAAAFWWEDAEARANKAEMPASSSVGCDGVQPPLPQPEKVHCEGLTPLFTVHLSRTVEMQRDFTSKLDFMHSFQTLNVNQIIFEMQKKSYNGIFLCVFVKQENPGPMDGFNFYETQVEDIVQCVIASVIYM